MASSFQSKIIKEFKEAGYYVIKHQRTNTNGLPDIQCIKEGKSIFIESKEEKDILSQLQKFRIDQLVKAGCDAFCIKDGTGIIYSELPLCKNARKIIHSLTQKKNS